MRAPKVKAPKIQVPKVADTPVAPAAASPAELGEDAASRELRAADALSTPAPKATGHHYNPIRGRTKTP